jgi:DTW domain-containing protein YfiP
MSADGTSPANHRLKSYKNKALDSQELRRRREEEGIQLRKQKRDEQVCTIYFLTYIYQKFKMSSSARSLKKKFDRHVRSSTWPSSKDMHVI